MIIVYATNEYGHGYVQKIAEIESIEEFQIYSGHFSKDVVISFEIENEEEES